MKADIITVGSVLPSVTGLLTRELPAFGLAISAHQQAEAEDAALRTALQEAMRRSDCVVLCASREQGAHETLAAVLGLPTEEGLPRGAVPFGQAEGAFEGFAVEKYGQLFLFLPPSANRLLPLIQTELMPYLAARSHGVFVTHTLGVFGLSEAAVAERLSDCMAEANPMMTLFPTEGGEILLRITAKAAATEAAEALCTPVITDVEERLGAYVFGRDVNSLQEAVVHLLTEKGMKVATAESCTAGMLSGKLTEVSGASTVFECGIAAYSKEVKRDMLGVSEETLAKHGAVSAETAQAMALGVRRVGGSTLGVSITGEAGPTSSEGKPVGTVFLALADARRVWVKELYANVGSRDTVREIATCQALDLVRRYLEAHPTVMAGGLLLEEGDNTPVIPTAAATKKRRLLPFLFPWRGDRPALWITKLLVWLTLIVGITFGWFWLNTHVIAPAQNREQFVSLELLYDRETANAGYNAANFPKGMLSRFYALYEKNPDIRGWVRIHDTAISYPVMQNGIYNYATTDFAGHSSPYGVPFFDANVAVSSPASVNRSYVIHGNNTGDGQMFSELMNYTDANFLLRHPLVEMNTLYATGMFEVFAVLYVDEHDTSFDYRTAAFDSNEEFLSFTEELERRSLFLTSVTLKKDDTLLLLETDASEKVNVSGVRLVVAARRLSLGEAAEEELVISYNPHALMPPSMRGESVSTTVTTTTTTLYQSSDIVPDIELPETDDTTEGSASAQETTTTETATTTAQTTTTAGSVAPDTTTAPIVTTTTSNLTTTTAPIVTTTTSNPATTTATTTTTTTTTTTKPPEGTVGRVAESNFYRGIKVRIAGGAVSTLETREDLQYAVACIVKTEMGASRSMQNSTEAQKAQAVASYTYMLYSCMNGSTFSISSSIDLSNANDRKIYEAVGDVVGVKMIDSAQTVLSRMPLCAMYSASCNGATASCQNVYTAALPYLQSVSSPYDTEEYIQKYSRGDRLTSTYSITWAELKGKLDAYVAADTKGSVTEVLFEEGDTPLFAKTFDGEGGYVVNTNAYYYDDGEKVYLRGIDIRKAIGSSRLRSHSFTLKYDANTDTVTFTVYGHGHALGLSQYGAIGYANEAGWTWRQILNHYYSLTDGGRYTIVMPLWE